MITQIKNALGDKVTNFIQVIGESVDQVVYVSHHNVVVHLLLVEEEVTQMTIHICVMVSPEAVAQEFVEAMRSIGYCTDHVVFVSDSAPQEPLTLAHFSQFNP